MNKLIFFIAFVTLISCKKDPIRIIESFKTSKASDKEGEIIDIDTALIVPFKSKSLLDFYNSRENQTVWQSEKNRKIILETIKNCEAEGLNPPDYNISKLVDLEKNFNKLDEDEQINYDLLLTYNFQKYLTHLHNGKLNPRKLYNNWDLHIDELDTKSILNNALTKDSLTDAIKKCQPKALTYTKLITALEIINKLPEDKTDSIITEDKIKHNRTYPAIINIKKKLLYWKDLESNDIITSAYDDKTFKAVKKFQTRHGLTPDGIIGKSTIKALNFTKEERKHQIIANLERWRWFAKSFTENYVLINIANYSLNVVQDQNITMSKRIVVGKTKRRTPVLTSVLQTIVFNPTWTVPPTILKEDIIPELIKNRNYLKNKGIGIYDSDSNEVDPLKWNQNRPRGYRYVQKPGYYNALGVVKINFPNRYSVYLHDTNHRDLFERNNRSLSSGCVRIEEPLELVRLLLDDPKKYSKEKMDSIIATKKTLFIGLTKRFAIYQWYWTAWSENDELIFRDDIYNLDADLYTKLRN
ncbi:L,D-transpeptidase family protein [Flavobacterium taihuense]|uniref:L,D-transpeptidase family protein n=1 Tax=Flavobacterium taihuense TaxID=2857508 RepID=A0ABS6XTW1_9FLAO|nr:L,D-transpeptidase family protein [Flavobacterium taihuense]MBW4359686.1 L,D-transpeptidase family protein [Flavobacterium taihuense]